MVKKLVNFGGDVMDMRVLCTTCKGKGKGGHGNCPYCRGKKISMQPRDIDFVVQKGMKQGDVVVFKGESEQTLETYPGDVYLTLRQTPHGQFKRVGNNLYTQLKITLEEAILGFQKKLKQLDGRQLSIETGQISQDGRVIVVEGEGMPLRGDTTTYGNLHVTLRVNFPNSYTPEQKEFIRGIYN